MPHGVGSTDDNGNTFASRVWLAWHALPRNEKGRPPRQVQLERDHGIGQGTFSRLFSGYIKAVEPATLAKMAQALATDPVWLVSGRGTPPTPTGIVPPMPGTLYVDRRTEVAEPYPNRGVAASIAQAGGVADAAIQSVLEESLELPEDPPALWWIDRMRVRELTLKSQARSVRFADSTPTPRSRVARAVGD